ncbi:MAG: RNA 2',3'-cyclic phosphodiesterase, partial [Betaproteobacteria bacterium]
MIECPTADSPLDGAARSTSARAQGGSGRSMARLFFAIWPPAATAQALQRWADGVRRETGGRTVSAAAIHLTLAFLGETPPQRAAPAIGAARRVRAAPHGLCLEEARYWAHNRIVWAGPRETPAALEALAQSLAAELARERFALEQRRFAA